MKNVPQNQNNLKRNFGVDRMEVKKEKEEPDR